MSLEHLVKCKATGTSGHRSTQTARSVHFRGFGYACAGVAAIRGNKRYVTGLSSDLNTGRFSFGDLMTLMRACWHVAASPI